MMKCHGQALVEYLLILVFIVGMGVGLMRVGDKLLLILLYPQ